MCECVEYSFSMRVVEHFVETDCLITLSHLYSRLPASFLPLGISEDCENRSGILGGKQTLTLNLNNAQDGKLSQLSNFKVCGLVFYPECHGN